MDFIYAIRGVIFHVGINKSKKNKKNKLRFDVDQ